MLFLDIFLNLDFHKFNSMNHRGLARFGSELYGTIYKDMVSYSLDPKRT